MPTIRLAFLLFVAAALSACASSGPVRGESRLGAAHRDRLAQTMSNAAMRYHQCDHVDSIDSSVVATGQLAPSMKALLEADGSSTERWVTSLCGKQIENMVFRGRRLTGQWITLVKGCSGPGAQSADMLVEVPEAGNGLSEMLVASVEKWKGPQSGLTAPASALVPLMTCTSPR